jgi:hypothetical protein
VKATDNADVTITSKVKITGQVNTKKEGTYKLKYSVTDKSKNTRTVTRVITIKKLEKNQKSQDPSINLFTRDIHLTQK